MLSPSERIHLIEGITEKLENKDYTHIDVVFCQFSVTGTRENHGHQRQYLLQSLKDASSGSLLALGEHFKLVEAKLHFARTDAGHPASLTMRSKKGRIFSHNGPGTPRR